MSTKHDNHVMDVYPALAGDKYRVENEDGTYSIIIPTAWRKTVKDAYGVEHTETVSIQQDHGTPEQLEQRRKALGIPENQWNGGNVLTSLVREVQ